MMIATIVGGQLGLQRVRNKKETQEEQKYLEKETKNSKQETRLSLQGQLKAARRILETFINPTIPKHKLLPKQVIKNVKAICFLTVYKAGLIIGANVGYGVIILRNNNISNKQWSYPISVGITAITHGTFGGGSFHKKDYLFTLNTDDAIQQLIDNDKLKLGDTLKMALGPIGRDQDINLYPKGDIYSYRDSYLDGKTITIKHCANETFYNLKGINIKNILSEDDMKYIDMPQNDHYDKIIDLLNTYCLEHVFPQNIVQKVDIEAIIKTHDVNIENSVNVLHSIYNDIDKEVIKVILMKQCWGNIKDAVDILSLMTKQNIDKENGYKIIKKHDIDNETETKQEISSDLMDKNNKSKTPFSTNKLIEIARSNTEKYLDLSDDENGYDDVDEMDKNDQICNTSKTTLLLDNLIKSFDH